MPEAARRRGEKQRTILLVGAYIVLIGVGTGISGRFGPAASVLTSFAMIGPILTIRDRLHDIWLRDHFSRVGALKMFAMITTGGLASLIANVHNPRIAAASFAAILLAELADTGIYALARHRVWFERVNMSNLVSSAMDSLVFPTIAFATLLPTVTGAQFSAKVAGGVIVTLALTPYGERKLRYAHP